MAENLVVSQDSVHLRSQWHWARRSVKDNTADKRTNGIVRDFPLSRPTPQTFTRYNLTCLYSFWNSFFFIAIFLFSISIVLCSNNFSLSLFFLRLGKVSRVWHPVARSWLRQSLVTGLNETDPSRWGGHRPWMVNDFHVLLSHSISSPWQSSLCHPPLYFSTWYWSAI